MNYETVSPNHNPNHNTNTMTRNLTFGTPGKLIFRKAKNRGCNPVAKLGIIGFMTILAIN